MEDGQDYQNEYDFTPIDDFEDQGKIGKKRLFLQIFLTQAVICTAVIAALGGMRFIIPDVYEKAVNCYRSEAVAGDDFKTGVLNAFDSISNFVNGLTPIEREQEQESSAEQTPSENASDAPAENAAQDTQSTGAGGEQNNIDSQSIPENCTLEQISYNGNKTLPLAGNITSKFGSRSYPLNGEPDFHEGVDIAAAEGTEIHVMSDGVVEKAEYSDGYGNYVLVDHQDNFKTLYAHCSELLVHPSDTVQMGQVIAKVGSTGASTGFHLHFGMQKDGLWINPGYTFAEFV